MGDSFGQVNYITVHLSQLGLVVPPWLGTISTGDGYGHRYGRKWRVLHIAVGPATRTAGILAHLVLNVQAVRLSWPSG